MSVVFDPDYRGDRIKNPFDTLFSDVVDISLISPQDFMVRLDLCIAVAAYSHSRIYRAIESMCSEVFPELLWNETLSLRAFNFAKECRLGLKIISDNEDIAAPMLKIKSHASVAVLKDLASHNQPTSFSDIIQRVSDAVAGKVANISIYSTRAREVIEQLFGEGAEKAVLNAQSINVLKSHIDLLSDLYDSIQLSDRRSANTVVPNRQPDSDLPATVNNSGPNESGTVRAAGINAREKAIKYANAVCLLEACIAKGYNHRKSLESAFSDNWKDVFGKAATDIKEIHELMYIVQNDQYLQAIEKLMHYSVRDLHSDAFLRKIVVARCVNRALSVVPRQVELDSVFDEALNLYSGINVISIGREEDDIRNYLTNFMLHDGSIDGRAIDILREHKKELYTCLEATRQGIAESKTRNRYVDNVVDEKDRQIADLQEQLDNSQFSSLYKLTDALSSRDYGYILGRIYRIAHGFDKPECESMVGLCEDILQILRTFGISPTHETSVGLEKIDEADQETKVLYDDMTGYTEPGIVFPGWKVKNDIVSLPVATLKTDE